MEIMLTETIQTQDELPANLPMAKELESTIGHTTPAIREIASIISQKGESQNGCFKKTKPAKFFEKWTFLTPWWFEIRLFYLITDTSPANQDSNHINFTRCKNDIGVLSFRFTIALVFLLLTVINGAICSRFAKEFVPFVALEILQSLFMLFWGREKISI